MKYTIEIAKDNDDWDSHEEINNDLFTLFLDKIIERYPNFAAANNLELSILLTNDKRIKELNKQFRGENKATNVLSFPDMEIDFRQILEFKPDLDYMYIGDIAFAFETIEAQARENNITFLQHFKHLLVHSILHLLGFDHQNDEEAKIMENIEVEILKQFSIASPY